MVQFTRSFFSLCLIAASFAAPAKRTVAQVEADIANISNQVGALDNAIKGLPDSGLVGALAIPTEMELLGTSLNTGTSDMKATGLLDETDATTILSAVKVIVPIINAALQHLTAQASNLVNNLLGLAEIRASVDSALQKLQNSTDTFVATLAAAAPVDLTAEAISIQIAIDAAFNETIAALSEIPVRL
ncbi:Hydrophobic surface binding protein [Mycena sanguinolenta]|uniref:Hydrophobic surface binding protein n=1 Tax=Mycena sanguinolenta TaxID=230812 RepID=A0A8H6XW59_9AGAR|nr:Hydrophobic surface binding protein [Mycena sanguinolenta]